MIPGRGALAGFALWALACAGCAAAAEKQSLSVAAASDLKFAMDEVSRDFGRAHPDWNLNVTYGSSGNFYSQIRSGAPFDIFLSADADYPKRLLADRVGLPDSLFIYGIGSIVVWTSSASKFDPATALREASLKRLAIANPGPAPYGRAAVAALRSLGLYDALASKLVMGENVAQAFAFVQSGAADAGIIAHSLAVSPEARRTGRYSELPESLYPRMEQAGLILKDSAAARALCAFLQSSQGRQILARYGFAQQAGR